MTKILYLVHVINVQGLQVHQENIQAILDWSTPRSLIELRGFFGMCNYYKRFVKGFSHLGASLTDLTKKGAFRWIKGSQQAFGKLKEVMSTCLVLTLLDFTQPFVL
jgi:hypothetical protein